MRTTLTVTLDKMLADFIYQQPGIIDPSAFINKLILDEMRRNGMPRQQAQANTPLETSKKQDLEVSLEMILDEQIPAAG